MCSVESSIQIIEQKIRSLGQQAIQEEYEHTEEIANQIINEIASKQSGNKKENVLFKWCKKLKLTTKLSKQKIYLLLYKNLFGRQIQMKETQTKIQVQAIRATAVRASIRNSIMKSQVYRPSLLRSTRGTMLRMTVKRQQELLRNIKRYSIGIAYLLCKLNQLAKKQRSEMIIKENNIPNLFTVFVSANNNNKSTNTNVFHTINIGLNSMKRIKTMCNGKYSLINNMFSFLPFSNKQLSLHKRNPVFTNANKNKYAIPHLHLEKRTKPNINYIPNNKLEYKVNLLPIKLNKIMEEPLHFQTHILSEINEVLVFNSNTIHDYNFKMVHPPLPPTPLTFFDKIDKCNLNEVFTALNLDM